MSKLIKKFSGGGASDGIYVSYPSQKITISGNKHDNVGGHGMVIAVDENTGHTRGSEYGRYRDKFGNARRVSVPNFHPADPGNPTEEELEAYAKKLAAKSGQEQVNVTYVKGPDYQEMVDYMKEAEKGKGYAEDPYNIWSHNCGTYGVECINQAMPWYRQVTGFGINAVNTIKNGIIGGLFGIGHAIESGDPGRIIDGVTSAGPAAGRADWHGQSLPWFTNKVTYKK